MAAKSQTEIRITRAGALAVHLMPWREKESLENAVKRIMRDGPTGKREVSAVAMANAEESPDPKIKTNEEK